MLNKMLPDHAHHVYPVRNQLICSTDRNSLHSQDGMLPWEKVPDLLNYLSTRALYYLPS